MIKLFSEMLITALYASVLQNLVFSSSLGIGESIKTARKPKYLVMYGIWVSFFALSVQTVCHILFRFGFLRELRASLRLFICVGILCAVYILSALFCKFILKADKKYMNSLGLCAFNSLIIGLPSLNLQLSNTAAEAVGTGLGAGLAFALSLLIINGGMKHIYRNPYIPEFFRGTPALFIYISLIALSLSCISGGSLFIY